jgi:hypothetical protein
MLKNRSPISFLYDNGGEAGYDTSNQTIVLELRNGDDIFKHDTDAAYHGFHYHCFSEIFFQQNVSDQIAVGR